MAKKKGVEKVYKTIPVSPETFERLVTHKNKWQLKTGLKGWPDFMEFVEQVLEHFSI